MSKLGGWDVRLMRHDNRTSAETLRYQCAMFVPSDSPHVSEEAAQLITTSQCGQTADLSTALQGLTHTEWRRIWSLWTDRHIAQPWATTNKPWYRSSFAIVHCDRWLTRVGSILIAFLAIIITVLLILRSERKQAAVGRRYIRARISSWKGYWPAPREFQLFLLGYIIVEICEIFTVGGFPLNERVRLVCIRSSGMSKLLLPSLTGI